MTGPGDPSPVAAEGVAGRSFDVFISYSRKDTAFALRLQRALERYTSPFERAGPRRLSIFLDQSDLTGVDYFDAIQRHLESARKLIVICSPDAAKSPYVDDEIERFVRLHGAAAVVPVLWRGLPNNEVAEGGERAFPPALVRSMKMPLAVDYRRLDAARERPDASEHQSAWIGLLANLLDRSRAEVEQREARRRRARLQLWTGSMGAVFAALAALTVWALIEGERALAGRLAAQAALPTGLDTPEVERRALLAHEAVRRLARLGERTLPGETPLRSALAQTSRRLLSLPAGERSFTFAADGEHVIAAEGGRLRALALNEGAIRHETQLATPLRRIEAGSDLRHVAGLDTQGRVALWSWPALDAVPHMPAEVSAAGVHCIGFDPSGTTLFALRLTDGTPRRAELFSWRPGEATLIDRAHVELTTAAKPLVAADECLSIRSASSGGMALLARLVTMGDDGTPERAMIVLRWKLHDTRWFPNLKLPPNPIQVLADARLAALDQNVEARVVAADGTRAAAANERSERRSLVSRDFSPLALSDDAQWLLTSRFFEDPYVPLLKATQFEIANSWSGDVWQALADHAGGGRFTPDAQRVATVSGSRVRLWDRRTGAELQRLFARGAIESLRFDATSRYAAAVMADGRIDVFAIGEPEGGSRRQASHVMTTLGGSLRSVSAHGKRLLVDPDGNGSLPVVLEIERYVDAMEPSPDGRWIALKVLAEIPMIRIGDPPNAEVWLLQIAPTPVVRHRGTSAKEVRFDARSNRLATLSAKGELRVFDLHAPERPVWQAETAHSMDARLAISDDGEVVAVASKSGLQVYAGRDGAPVRQDGEPTLWIALSADGRLLARMTEAGKLRVEQSADGVLVRALEDGVVTGLRDLVFSPKARRLMGFGGTTFGTFLGSSHFAEQHLGVWDIATGRILQRIPGQAGTRKEYQEAIGAKADEYMQLNDLVWNRHTREIAAVVYPSVLAYWTLSAERVTSQIQVWRLDDDGLVEVFRTDNLLQLRPLVLGGGTVLGLKSEDGFKHVIDASGKRLPELTCRWIGRKLTAEEETAALGSGVRRAFTCPPRAPSAEPAK